MFIWVVIGERGLEGTLVGGESSLECGWEQSTKIVHKTSIGSHMKDPCRPWERTSSNITSL
jgi:hypothetical protein